LKKTQQGIYKFYLDVAEHINKNAALWNNITLTFDEFKRNVQLIMTRGFYTTKGKIALIPFVDLINNYCDAGVEHPDKFQATNFDDEKKIITSRVTVGAEPGNQIFSCYVSTQQPRLTLWQHGYTPERRSDQTVALDNLAFQQNDPLASIKDKLVSEFILKGRDAWDICVLETGIPVDTTLSIAMVIVETDPSYLTVEKFSSMFTPTEDGRLPALARAENAMMYIIDLVKQKISYMQARHTRSELVQLINDESLPYHERQIKKLMLQELDILIKLHRTDLTRWQLYPTLRRTKVPPKDEQSPQN